MKSSSPPAPWWRWASPRPRWWPCPTSQVRDIQPLPGLKPYTSAQLRGREVYIANGCVYCHTQQPRDRNLGPDFERGWGRASVPADYVYDKPHLLGSMRTGPDLFNIGARQPSKDWHLGHLYQPSAYVPGSIMPAYPYLFNVKDAAGARRASGDSSPRLSAPGPARWSWPRPRRSTWSSTCRHWTTPTRCCRPNRSRPS